jgi:YHS domain-containing protein
MEILRYMKKVALLASLVVGAFTLTAAPSETAQCPMMGGCCGSVTPMADSSKSDVAAKPYPLDTCIVSGEKLDSDPDMKSYSFVHEGQEIKLCCKNCKKKFDKDPAKYMKKLADASTKK